MIYVSGEAGACAEIEALVPGITTTAVKRGLSRRSAVSWTAEKARAMIRGDVRDAVANLGNVRPLRFAPPLRFRDERYEETWKGPAADPDVRVIDANTREIEAEDILDLLTKIYGYERGYRAEPLR
jgi:D-amino peptidase